MDARHNTIWPYNYTFGSFSCSVQFLFQSLSVSLSHRVDDHVPRQLVVVMTTYRVAAQISLGIISTFYCMDDFPLIIQSVFFFNLVIIFVFLLNTFAYDCIDCSRLSRLCISSSVYRVQPPSVLKSACALLYK